MNVVLKQGKMNTKVQGDYNLDIDGNYTVDVKGNRLVNVGGTTTDNTQQAVLHTGQNYKVLANRIDLNEYTEIDDFSFNKNSKYSFFFSFTFKTT